MASIDPNLLVLGAALLVVLLVGWWLLRRGQTGARPRAHRPDVLDEGAAPAQRNQALIDAPPAAIIVPPPVAGGMAGVGEIVAVAAQDTVEELGPAPAPGPAPHPMADPSPVLPDESPVEPEPVHQIPAEPAEQPEPIVEPSAPPQPVAPAPAPAPALTSAGDDLSRIKGLGPKLQALLPQLGITTFAQIAALTDADLAELDGKLGAFAGRPKRDNWMEQASYLAAGDVAGFEARFGKL